MGKKIIKLAKKGVDVTNNNETNTTNGTKSANVDVRKEMAKAKVDELLQDIDVDVKIKKDVLGIDLPTKDEISNNDVTWLQEQLSILVEKYETVSNDYSLLREEYEKMQNEFNELKKLPQNDEVKDVVNNVIAVFNELQTNHMKYGHNFIIYPIAFMNRLIIFFPFLSKYKKY